MAISCMFRGGGQIKGKLLTLCIKREEIRVWNEVFVPNKYLEWDYYPTENVDGQPEKYYMSCCIWAIFATLLPMFGTRLSTVWNSRLFVFFYISI